jgi:hypothetical protein
VALGAATLWIATRPGHRPLPPATGVALTPPVLQRGGWFTGQAVGREGLPFASQSVGPGPPPGPAGARRAPGAGSRPARRSRRPASGASGSGARQLFLLGSAGASVPAASGGRHASRRGQPASCPPGRPPPACRTARRCLAEPRKRRVGRGVPPTLRQHQKKRGDREAGGVTARSAGSVRLRVAPRERWRAEASRRKRRREALGRGPGTAHPLRRRRSGAARAPGPAGSSRRGGLGHSERRAGAARPTNHQPVVQGGPAGRTQVKAGWWAASWASPPAGRAEN